MNAFAVEATTFARRLSRRRLVLATLGLDAALLLWAVLAPPASARGALAAAEGLGVLTLLVLSSGCVADDRDAGRLVLPATHPAPRSAWVVGRWVAVAAGAGAVTAMAAEAMALAAPGLGSGPRFALGVACAVLNVAALSALAVALSCGAGPTGQVLVLLGLLLAGLVAPDVVGTMLGRPWVEPVVRAAWTVLPTGWALDRLERWALGIGAPHPFLALALLAQTPFWLLAAGRAVARAQPGTREGGR